LAERLLRQASVRLVTDRARPEIADTFGVHRSGNAWAVELEFLQDRAKLLGCDLPGWSDPKCTWVSDFWFTQSLAYAEVRLSPRQYDLFCPIWEDARSRVIRPKLTVLLDVATDRLVCRLRSRGCEAADGLMSERLEVIRQAFLRFADSPGYGPVIWLADESEDRIFDEVAAAVEAMNT
jgi:deoxyadenosine/deoxycytidine kinase